MHELGDDEGDFDFNVPLPPNPYHGASLGELVEVVGEISRSMADLESKFRRTDAGTWDLGTIPGEWYRLMHMWNVVMTGFKTITPGYLANEFMNKMTETVAREAFKVHPHAERDTGTIPGEGPSEPETPAKAPRKRKGN